MGKRILCILAALMLLVGTCLPVMAEENYWTLAVAYEDAKKSGNDNTLAAAALKIVNFYSGEKNETAYLRTYDPLVNLGKIYERQGKYDLCYGAYEKLYTGVAWLSQNASTEANRAGYFEVLQGVSRKKRYFEAPQLYALSTDPTKTVKYGQLNEPAAGTYIGMCDTYQEQSQSAYLLYIQYLTNRVSDFIGLVPSTNDTLYLELAWNVKNETKADLDEINSGSTDSYMKAQLQTLEQYALAHPNVKILLRFGAEMNCWASLNTYGTNRAQLLSFAETFKTAFRRVATEARSTAPHVAMVLSYVDYGNWYTRPQDFYPGDAYVDWIGMSTYYTPQSSTPAIVGKDSDMLYGTGLYQNNITRIGEIVDLARAHDKPVMVSECGFRYSDTQDPNLPATAQKLRHFFTYINMVYPEIKTVNYFNTNFNGNRYRLYPLDGYASDPTFCTTLKDAYEETILKNGAMTSTLPGSEGLAGYTTIGGVNNASGTVTVSAYIGYPTTSTKTVTYKLNGNTLATTSTMPYSVTLDAANMTEGANTLTAVITCANTTVTKTATLYAAADGSINGDLTAKTDLAAGAWYMNAIGYCLHEGLMTGTAANRFSPQTPVTRAMLAQVLYNMSGAPAVTVPVSFSDVSPNAWYATAVAWAEQNGVVYGVGGNRFAPEAIITRETVVTMLQRYEKMLDPNLVIPDASVLASFPDKDTVSAWAMDGVCWAVEAQIISGKNGLLDPAGNALRCELAQILWKCCTQ